MSALDTEARDRRLSLAFAGRVGEATPAPDALRVDQSARLLGAARERDALIARVRELEAALREALDGWEAAGHRAWAVHETAAITRLRALLGGHVEPSATVDPLCPTSECRGTCDANAHDIGGG